jgi:hypothetical protein
VKRLSVRRRAELSVLMMPQCANSSRIAVASVIGTATRTRRRMTGRRSRRHVLFGGIRGALDVWSSISAFSATQSCHVDDAPMRQHRAYSRRIGDRGLLQGYSAAV